MPSKRYRSALAAAAAAVSLPVVATFAQLVSFPGAEGFGDLTTGGRSGSVYLVTNLNDSGAGSFRDAVSASNRIVVFGVGGYIHLASAVSAKSNLTILGQTAPGDGIGIMGAEVSFFGQSNDIIQYMRFRDGTIDPGYKGSSTTSSSSSNCLNFGSSNNEILDHVSAEFAAYNDIDANQATNFTAQNSLISDPIASQRFNFHQEGSPATFIGNVFANGHNRAPLSKANAQYVNNVVYNYQAGFTAGNSSGHFSYDIINNYFVAGPSTTSATDNFYQFNGNQSAYATGNLLDSNTDGLLNGSADNTVASALVLASPWSSATAQLPTLSAPAAWSRDVVNAGDSLKHDPTTFASSQGYDQVDSLVANDVKSNGTSGMLWTSETQTGLTNGGFGVINSGNVPTSSANDGLPDTWAVTHGLSPTGASSATKLNALGYTMIEQYAYEISDLNASQTWSSSTGEWTANSANWSAALPGAYDHALIRGTGASNGSVTLSNAGATAFSLSIGGNGPAAGESMFVTGGSLTVYNTVTVGDQNNALLQITGGTLTAGNVQLGNTVWDTGGNPTTYTGTLQLNGGVLQAAEVVQGGGSPSSWTTGSNWTWGNGTLQAGLNGLNVTAPAAITGSATLDTNGQSANMSGVLSGTGSLTKIGSGVATMIRTDSYSGGTIINAGALKAHTNGSLGSGTVTINVADGLQIQNGLTIPNTIIANSGSSEFVDVPDTNASATLSGNISLASQSSDQYRVGVSGSGATLTLTGASTVGSAISLITRGNILFAQNGTLNVSNNSLEIGRFSSTSSVNFTVTGNASVAANGIALGGLNGSSDDLNTNVTLTGSGILNAGASSLNLDNSATANNTTTFTLGGLSNLFAGGIVETSTATGRVVTMNLSGGAINATAADPIGGSFFPALSNATVHVQTGGAIVNNAGFNISIAQPLTGSAGDGGFTAQGAGTTTLAAANSYTGPTNVTAGTLVIASPGALPASGNVTNNASFNVAANTSAGNISGTGSTTVNAGSSLTAGNFSQSNLTNNGTTQINGAGTVGLVSGTGTLVVGTGSTTNTLQLAQNGGLNQQGALIINPGSALDLTNNRLIINYGTNADPITTITGYLATGFNGGTWNGPGINSSTAAANSGSYALGYADAADPGNPAGLASGTIEVEYTLIGDADLNRIVNGIDFGILAANFNKGVTSWDQGDFGYNGIVNGIDFGGLAANFNQGASGAAGASAADFAALDAFAAANGLLSYVPEPTTVAGTTILALIGSLKCRPRRPGEKGRPSLKMP